MEVLSTVQLRYIGSKVHPGKIYHVTTIAFTQTLLMPYAQVIEGATTVKSIIDWVRLALPEELAKHAVSELNKASWMVWIKDEYRDLPEGQEIPDAVTAAKNAVIEYLVAEIYELAGNSAYDRKDTYILPWDVQKAIGLDEELRVMCGINYKDRHLPVTVSVGPQQFTHMMTQDLLCGLLLFSSVAKHDFHITMYGAPFLVDYIVDPDNSYLFENDDIIAIFSVMVDGHTYHFETPDFMQGIATGATWLNIDHHQYWSTLIQHDYETEGKTVLSF